MCSSLFEQHYLLPSFVFAETFRSFFR